MDPTDASNREALTDREVAERFIELFHRQDRIKDAFDLWVHPDYIQHNPNAPAGRDATLEAILGYQSNYPAMTHDVKRVMYSDGGLAVVHHNFRRWEGDRGYAVVDIFRVEKGYVVEHWDVIQEVPETARNQNSMF